MKIELYKTWDTLSKVIVLIPTIDIEIRKYKIEFEFIWLCFGCSFKFKK